MEHFKSGIYYIALAIVGYLMFNTGILLANGYLNYGIFNIAGGLATATIFYKKVKALPKINFSLLGAIGILCIVFGLRKSYDLLMNPTTVMDLTYDNVVFSILVVFFFVENIVNHFKDSPKSKIYKFDVNLHVLMALLVSARLIVHWDNEWTFDVTTMICACVLIYFFFRIGLKFIAKREEEDRLKSIHTIGLLLVVANGFFVSFCPSIILTVLGYWLFNISLRLSSLDEKSRVPTNVCMNVIGGLAICAITIFMPETERQINYSIIIGAIGIICIVYGLGKAYAFWKEIGLAPAVTTANYDGLLLFASPYFSLFFNKPFFWYDWLITLGFVIVLVTRLAYFYNEEATFELKPPKTKLCLLFLRP